MPARPCSRWLTCRTAGHSTPDDGSATTSRSPRGPRPAKSSSTETTTPPTAEVSFKAAEEGPYLDHEIYSYDSSKADRKFTEGVDAFAAATALRWATPSSRWISRSNRSPSRAATIQLRSRRSAPSKKDSRCTSSFSSHETAATIVTFSSMALGEPFPHDQLTGLMKVALERLDGQGAAA